MSTLNPVIPADAPCVSVYNRLRDGVPPDSAQIGYGYNLYPVCPLVSDHLRVALRICVRDGRLAEYGTTHDARDRALAAALLSDYLEIPITSEQVIFTNGATEGIAITMEFVAQCGAGVWLPLPSYYAFEQNLAIHNGAVIGHYRDDDRRHPSGARSERSCVVEIVPNGVTGTLIQAPIDDPDLRVVDLVFQAGNNITGAARAARTAVRPGLDSIAVLMTPAKDLCLPGLRAGMLVTGSKALLAAARRRHFTGLATINPLVGQLMLLYLAALLLLGADRAPGELRARYQWIRTQFETHDVSPVPTLKTVCGIVDHWTAMSQHVSTNLRILADHSDGVLSVPSHPVAGYSVLAELHHPRFADAMDLVDWVNRSGRHHALKLNPHLLFGGTADTWQALYPGQHHIRVNLSVPHSTLQATLSTLHVAAHEFDRRPAIAMGNPT